MNTVFIAIPVYNAAPYLAIAIESVLAQTYTHWSLLILDDLSTDGSYDIAYHYSQKDARIRVLKNTSRLGAFGNWEKAMALCDQPYFTRLDADDYWSPDAIQVAVDILDQQPLVGLVFSDYAKISREGNMLPEKHEPVPPQYYERPFYATELVKLGTEKMLAENILRQGFLLLRTTLMKYGTVNAILKAADTELYYRYGAHSQIYIFPRPYYFYRTTPLSYTANLINAQNTEYALYEVKKSILTYYWQNGFASYTAYKKGVRYSAWKYRLYKTAQANAKGSYFISAKYFLQNMFLLPFLTLSFYTKRFLQKR